MKIAFVIPSSYMPLIEEAIHETGINVQAEYIIYNNYIEAPNLICGKQTLWDGIIFAGRGPYKLCLEHMRAEVLWGYFQRDSGSILKALFSAANKGWDWNRLSVDAYGENIAKELYEVLNMESKTTMNQVYWGDVLDPAHNEKAYRFHYNNYKKNHASGCLTHLYAVSERLQAEGIPVTLVVATRDAIRDQILNMYRLYNSQHSSNNNFVVCSICIDYPEEYSLLLSSEYQYAMERAIITGQIYQYANQIHGSVAEVSPREYLIFSDRTSFELDSSGFTQSTLLERIMESTSYKVHIGIGCGDTVLTAQRRSTKAQIRIKDAEESLAFCLLSDEIWAEIRPTANPKNVSDIDEKFFRIACQSGVSTQTIYAIYSFVTERRNDTFTAKELAAYLKISVRNTNRIVEKLQDSNYITILKKPSPGAIGRPSRLLKFTID